MRADLLLVQRGLAPSRSAAQRLIDQGAVRWRDGGAWQVPRKAGESLPPGCELSLDDDAELRFVSRGGLKLDAALQHCGAEVRGLHLLDVGQGTGGFTDVLLQRGAASVTGVDVGHGQLHERLRTDPRVTAFEGLNARDLATAALPRERYDAVVGDLSFISLRLVLPALVARLQPTGWLLLLVKPQFELQRADIGRGGLVRDEVAAAVRVQASLREACAGCALQVHGYFDSAIRGGDGNREHFLHAAPAATGTTPLNLTTEMP